MIFKTFKNGVKGSSRSGANAFNYLLGVNRDRDNARILYGNEHDTLAIIDNLEYKNLYGSGVLSFEENNISEEDKYNIIESFEKCLFPSMEKQQYNIVWIEHRDKGRLELNYIIPMQELSTGKFLEVYMSSRDYERVKSWQEIINYEYELTSPDEHTKKRFYELPKNLSKDRQKATEEISIYFQNKVLNGLLCNREEIINELQSKGYEVTRQTKSSISIKTKEHGTLRLKGEIFKSEFDTNIVSNEYQEMVKASFNEVAKKEQYSENKKNIVNY